MPMTMEMYGYGWVSISIWACLLPLGLTKVFQRRWAFDLVDRKEADNTWLQVALLKALVGGIPSFINQRIPCSQGRVVRFVLQSFSLRGTLAPHTLSLLDQLRVLSLHNNSLSGPLPNLSSLSNLKYLFLNRNSFSGSFPPSLLALHRLRALDLSHNNFTGSIPALLTGLDRLNSLHLEFNRFNSSFPALNQSFLTDLNVSSNNLTGPVPGTPLSPGSTAPRSSSTRPLRRDYEQGLQLTLTLL
ncbi:probable inactive receptor kinase At5g67200 [Rosa chinensis]|uniref:probable inactive receptor kinase At5g67200 n=1 Tax=Rosa chinensis TaxID=74649 RepID=UPI000D095476|nr:probable inactive receptor kinase At5g67200 [Rosa chinensis]